MQVQESKLAPGTELLPLPSPVVNDLNILINIRKGIKKPSITYISLHILGKIIPNIQNFSHSIELP